MPTTRIRPAMWSCPARFVIVTRLLTRGKCGPPGSMAAPKKSDVGVTLLGVLLALFLGALDQTIVATALPKIVEELHGLTRYTWTATAYLLGSTVMVPIYGKLSDMYSRRTIEVCAVVLFLLGSVLCGAAGILGPLPVLGDGMMQLIIFRGIQGLGA